MTTLQKNSLNNCTSV
ncbi:UNVERIFIED_CONTAM: hypothetical protein GTU68_019952 [Idotea baltica]|nr:hypothetical protein [Idotea baltica]